MSLFSLDVLILFSSGTSESDSQLSSPRRVHRCGILCLLVFSLCFSPCISPSVSDSDTVWLVLWLVTVLDIRSIVPVAFSEARFQVKKCAFFGAMEDIRNDKYLARS